MNKTIRHQGKWLNFLETTFTNSQGNEVSWEYASRSGTNQAACVVAKIQEDLEKIVLVKQFRPPVGAYVLELPAGLVDEGESVTNAALRELEEETGYIGEVISQSPPIYSSPGMTDENVVMVEVRIIDKAGQKLEADENLEVVLAPLSDLKDFLLREAASGVHIDAKLWSYCQGRAEV